MEAWLLCEVSTGQFSTEAAVRGKNSSGKEFSLFAPIQDVRSRGALGDEWEEGSLRVEVLEAQNGYHLVYLPSQTFESGQTVTVRSTQLERSPSAV
ncbi:MAG TPA: hypothetical protein VFI31_15415 [Pirellulales bacterium]|nr:hypothetical protein [Pirellulales bacterium]